MESEPNQTREFIDWETIRDRRTEVQVNKRTEDQKDLI